ncbi:caveolin-3-like [Uloborus diversus]|uniref:caveolin-3-like n=1 Tax=Uloborus diversus TaxID=327109 RepID=UPI0024097526|nr:caveolin-3-like [Uloborus diversus]
MDSSKDKSSRSSSKANLNESSVPLLDDEEVTLKGGESKVTIEMDTRSSDENEKGDANKDKEEEAQADGKSDAKDEKESKKEKKEKKKKEKKEKTHKRTTSLAEKLTTGLNLLDRDDRNVNDHVNIVFEDLLAEPDASHGFDAVWRMAFIVFSGTKLWVYRIVSALLAIPCGFLWGAVFSILTLVNVWVISPTLRTFDVFMHILHRVWSAVVHTFLDPIFLSVGHLCSNININNTSRQVLVQEA